MLGIDTGRGMKEVDTVQTPERILLLVLLPVRLWTTIQLYASVDSDVRISLVRRSISPLSSL